MKVGHHLYRTCSILLMMRKIGARDHGWRKTLSVVQGQRVGADDLAWLSLICQFHWNTDYSKLYLFSMYLSFYQTIFLEGTKRPLHLTVVSSSILHSLLSARSRCSIKNSWMKLLLWYYGTYFTILQVISKLESIISHHPKDKNITGAPLELPLCPKVSFSRCMSLSKTEKKKTILPWSPVSLPGQSLHSYTEKYTWQITAWS